MRILVVMALLWSVTARAEEASLDKLFEAVNASVVLVRTWEHAVVAQDSLGLIPMSDLGSGVWVCARAFSRHASASINCCSAAT